MGARLSEIYVGPVVERNRSENEITACFFGFRRGILKMGRHPYLPHTQPLQNLLWNALLRHAENATADCSPAAQDHIAEVVAAAIFNTARPERPRQPNNLTPLASAPHRKHFHQVTRKAKVDLRYHNQSFSGGPSGSMPGPEGRVFTGSSGSSSSGDGMGAFSPGFEPIALVCIAVASG